MHIHFPRLPAISSTLGGRKTGVEEIAAEETMEDSRMFDLMGREIRNPLPGTIYIQGGRKFIAR